MAITTSHHTGPFGSTTRWAAYARHVVNMWRARTEARKSLPSLTLGTDAVPGTQLLDGAERWAEAFARRGSLLEVDW